mmetsp:Transcript_5482/g.14319  ORF Transcript_5482/g.14319 Transcript_5482/m.14319 type:complete len:209 (-) Transcript_5482:459-1085(-)
MITPIKLLTLLRPPYALLDTLPLDPPRKVLPLRHVPARVSQPRPATRGVHVVVEAERHDFDERGAGRHEDGVGEISAVDTEGDARGPERGNLGAEGERGVEDDGGELHMVLDREFGQQLPELGLRLLLKLPPLPSRNINYPPLNPAISAIHHHVLHLPSPLQRIPRHHPHHLSRLLLFRRHLPIPHKIPRLQKRRIHRPPKAHLPGGL